VVFVSTTVTATPGFNRSVTLHARSVDCHVHSERDRLVIVGLVVRRHAPSVAAKADLRQLSGLAPPTAISAPGDPAVDGAHDLHEFRLSPFRAFRRIPGVCKKEIGDVGQQPARGPGALNYRPRARAMAIWWNGSSPFRSNPPANGWRVGRPKAALAFFGDRLSLDSNFGGPNAQS
jgi:hypothetical protein